MTNYCEGINFSMRSKFNVFSILLIVFSRLRTIALQRANPPRPGGLFFCECRNFPKVFLPHADKDSESMLGYKNFDLKTKFRNSTLRPDQIS
jgi:hypothetical protein